MFFNVFSERMVCSFCGMNVWTPGNSEIAIFKDFTSGWSEELKNVCFDHTFSCWENRWPANPLQVFLSEFIGYPDFRIDGFNFAILAEIVSG